MVGAGQKGLSGESRGYVGFSFNKSKGAARVLLEDVCGAVNAEVPLSLSHPPPPSIRLAVVAPSLPLWGGP